MQLNLFQMTSSKVLRKLLDNDNANPVINSIIEEIIKEVQFSLTGNSSNKEIMNIKILLRYLNNH